MKVADLRKLLEGLDGDVEVLLKYETTANVYTRDCQTAEVHDNGERQFVVLSSIDPNVDPAVEATKRFMRGGR